MKDGLYLDTSALIKLYLKEPGREWVMPALHAALEVGTSSLTLVEIRATLSRALKGKRLRKKQYQRLVAQFASDGPSLAEVESEQKLLLTAAALADLHALRAYDAVHLASALKLRADIGVDVVFATFDAELRTAALKEGFLDLPP